MIIQKSNEGNSAVISQRYGYLKKQEYILMTKYILLKMKLY